MFNILVAFRLSIPFVVINIHVRRSKTAFRLNFPPPCGCQGLVSFDAKRYQQPVFRSKSMCVYIDISVFGLKMYIIYNTSVSESTGPAELEEYPWALETSWKLKLEPINLENFWFIACCF